jgi:hypothetical protein
VTQSYVRVPEHADSQAGSGRHHTCQGWVKGRVRHLVYWLVVPFDRLTMVLVLVDPTASLLSFDHELVVSEASVDEGVDERASQIGSCRIDRG